MSTAGEGVRFAVTASHSYLTALVQGEPDPFNEAPPAPAGPYQNGRDETRAGMWDSSAQQHWAEAEQAWTAGIAQPSGLPSVAPQNVLMQPMFEEESTTSRKVEREDLDEVPAHAVASTYPQLPIGSLNGGRPLPWESGFPGGGSSGVETVVNSNTGNLNLRVPIMSWKMRGGMEIDFSLYYNSRSQVWTRFGRNWSSSFDAFIWKFPVIPGLSSLFVRWGDGSIVKFNQTAPGSWTYKSPAGIHETITESFPNPDTYTLKTKSGMKYVFQQLNASPVWFLTKIQERISSNEIIIHREASNPYTLTRVSEPGLGDRLSVGAITGSRVTTINDFTIGGNRTWTLGYVNNGENIASITYPQSGGNGPTRSFTYQYIEGLPFLESETDLRGKTWYWSFDSAGVCLSYSTPTTYIMVDELPAYYFQYTGDSCTWVKPYRGNYGSGFRTSQRHQYSAGRISHVYDEAGFYESMTWTVGDLSVYKDKRQAMWAYVYDANGNVTQTTTPTGEIQKYAYTADNDLESTYSDQVAPSVHRFSYSDGRCINVTRRANPIGIDNAQTSATIAGPGQHHGQYLSVTPWGPGGGTAWNIVYRTDDRYRQFIEKLIDPQGNQTLVNVDEWGRVLTVTPPGQSATTITYDGRMRPYRVTHPGGDYVEVTYDGEDHVTSLRDEMGRVSYWVYDDDGRLISYQNPKGEVETYTYDAQSFLHQVTNARGYTRTYVPNLRNEVYRLTHADGQKEYWSYYATGEVAAYVDGFGTADQTVVSYGVDASGRPTGITYPEGSGTPNVVITYSNYGRTVTMVDGSGTSKWIHDGFGRLTRFEQPGWNIDYGYSLYHDTPVSMTDPSGTTSYEYDNRGNLWKLTNPVNEVTEWLYDPAGRLSQRKLGNGTW
ncbi:MAG: RHS repeat protein, partial [Methanoregulaceae archaeon]|nr:RHS repeat protein [Methanoregulaceae archaeon]